MDKKEFRKVKKLLPKILQELRVWIVTEHFKNSTWSFEYKSYREFCNSKLNEFLDSNLKNKFRFSIIINWDYPFTSTKQILVLDDEILNFHGDANECIENIINSIKQEYYETKMTLAENDQKSDILEHQSNNIFFNGGFELFKLLDGECLDENNNLRYSHIFSFMTENRHFDPEDPYKVHKFPILIRSGSKDRFMNFLNKYYLPVINNGKVSKIYQSRSIEFNRDYYVKFWEKRFERICIEFLRDRDDIKNITY